MVALLTIAVRMSLTRAAKEYDVRETINWPHQGP